MAVNEAARTGARTGSGVGPDRLADYYALSGAKSALESSGKLDRVQRVQTTGDGASANRYAIRARSFGSNKPRVSAYGDMSMFNNISAGNANFYLAEVEPAHRGKTLEVLLYDPGEVSGNSTMRVLAPNGSVAPSCIGLHDGPGGTNAQTTFASGATLRPCQFQASRGGPKFDGLWVTLQIKIPTDYTCQMGTIPGCWWKIQYAIDGQATDTTTWAAQITGDPVHLVEETD